MGVGINGVDQMPPEERKALIGIIMWSKIALCVAIASLVVAIAALIITVY